MNNKQRRITFLNLFLSVQRDLIVGGQAVMEGVMMRTPSAYAIAVRKKDGSIVHTAEALPKWICGESNNFPTLAFLKF